jgi:SPIRAL1-like protein
MKVIGSTAPTVKPDEKPAARPAGGSGISSNAYAQGSRQNVGNVITDRPTSRVTQPPGGRSSISFF